MEYEKELRFLGRALPPQKLSTFETLREVTGWVRPKHDHGCKPCTIVSGVWTAHYHDIDSKEKLAKVAPKVPHVSSYCYVCGPYTSIQLYVSSQGPYYYTCVIMLLYMCPHTTIHVSSYYYTCVLIIPSVLILLRVLILLCMCPRLIVTTARRRTLTYADVC